MLGYLWIQYPMRLDIIPPNLFKTKLDRGRRLPVEKRESHIGPKPITEQLDCCSLEASEQAAGAGREVKRVSVFQTLEKRPEDFTFPSTCCSLQVTARAE